MNIMAEADSLKVIGEEHIGFHHGMEHDKDTDELKRSEGGRYFCRECGSPLWAADPRWSEWVYPYPSAIQTSLPESPEMVHIMLDFKVPWVNVPTGERHKHFNRYPDESVEHWHKRHGFYLQT